MRYEEAMLIACILIGLFLGLAGLLGKGDEKALAQCREAFSPPVCQQLLR